jgi:sulfotransferase
MQKATANVHVIAGLPRSGSTLLSALLEQNPRFAPVVNSPVYDLSTSMLEQMSPRMAYSRFLNDDRRRSLLRAIFDACYDNPTPEQVIFDTNRMWPGRAALLKDLYPKLRMICCVRDIGWIINSIEHLLRSNPLQTSVFFDFKAGSSVYARAQALTQIDRGLIGLALSLLREAWHGEHAGMLVVVRYDSLVRDPRTVLSRVYDELGEQPFEHDFEALSYDDAEYDALLGAPGMHKVEGRVEPLNRESVIPPELFTQYSELSFWEKPQSNLRNVVVL